MPLTESLKPGGGGTAESEGFDRPSGAREVLLDSIAWLAAARGRSEAGVRSDGSVGASGVAPWWGSSRGAAAGARREFRAGDAGAIEMTVIPYVASGGDSLLMQMDDGDEVQVEVHLESYSVLWSSRLPASAVLRNLTPLVPMDPREAMAVCANGDVEDGDVQAVLDLVEGRDAAADEIAFFRLRYEDRAVTWEQRPIRSLYTGMWSVVGRIGFLAYGLDERYLTELIARTAPRLGVAAPAFARRVAGVVAAAGRFPIAELGTGTIAS